MMNNNVKMADKVPLTIDIDDQDYEQDASFIKRYMAPMFTPSHYKGIAFNPYSSQNLFKS